MGGCSTGPMAGIAQPQISVVHDGSPEFACIAYDKIRDRCLVGGNGSEWQQLVCMDKPMLYYHQDTVRGSIQRDTRALLCCDDGITYATSRHSREILRTGVRLHEWRHAEIPWPCALAVRASDGLLLVSDVFCRRIFGVSRSTGDVCVIAGSGRWEPVDGIGTTAGFVFPAGLCCDARGNTYISDWMDTIGSAGGTSVRHMTPAGFVSTIAGLDVFSPLGLSTSNPVGALRLRRRPRPVHCACLIATSGRSDIGECRRHFKCSRRSPWFQKKPFARASHVIPF